MCHPERSAAESKDLLLLLRIRMPSPNPANAPEPLPAALLLAATGGLLDGFVYLNHGHVFANAMTGNVVLLGIDLLTKDYAQCLRHLAPLAAFFLGVTTSKLVQSRLSGRASTYGLALELAVLMIASLLPLDFPEMAFVSSFQITSFRRVGTLTYSSTFVTGNLRDMAVGFYEMAASSTPEDRLAGRLKARHLGLICFAFLLGVMTGAWAAPRFFNHTLWIAGLLLALVVCVLYLAGNRASTTAN
jgi:uncharacterized membrane protein YoaK (UPF0700 family)